MALSLLADIPGHQLGWRMAVLPFRSMGASVGSRHRSRDGRGSFRSSVSLPCTTIDGERHVLGWSGPAADALGRCLTYQLDYIIDGTIQVIDDQIRVKVTLLDVVFDFEVVWSECFDGTLDDLFSLQHRIASETVAQVDPEMFRRGSAFEALVKTGIPRLIIPY